MRCTRRIVNEMEFRMLRKARSFSPSPHAATMKGFLSRDPIAFSVATAASASLRIRVPRARVAFC